MAEETSPVLQQLRELNPELLGGETDPTIAEVLWQSEVVDKGYEEFNDKDDFFQSLGTLRNDLSYTDSLGRAFSRGWYRVSDAFDLVDQNIRQVTGEVLAPIMPSDEEYAERRQARDIATRRNVPSLDTMNKLQAITADDATFWDMVKNADDWTLISTLLAESLTQYAPVLGAAALTGLTGGAAAPITAPLVAALVSTGMMSSSAFHEYLRKEGKIESAEDYLKAFENPELMNKAAEHGWKYGIPIGALDGLSMGLAGNVARVLKTAGQLGRLSKMAPAARVAEATAEAVGQSNKLRKVGKWGTEAGVQSGLGGAGEALGSLWSTGKINAGEVFLEAIIEPAMLPLELAAKSPRHAARTLKRLADKQGRGEKLTPAEVKEQEDATATDFARTEEGQRRAAERATAQTGLGINEEDYGAILQTIGEDSVAPKTPVNIENMNKEIIGKLVRNNILVSTESVNQFEYEFTEEGAIEYNRLKELVAAASAVKPLVIDPEEPTELAPVYPPTISGEPVDPDVDPELLEGFPTEAARFGPPPIEVEAETKLTGVLPTVKDATKVRPGVYEYKNYLIQHLKGQNWAITEPGAATSQDTTKTLKEALELIHNTEEDIAETGPMASFLESVEENKHNLTRLRTFFRDVLEDRNIDEKDQRKVLAFGALQQIMGEDAGIFPEAIALTDQEKINLQETLRAANVDQQIADRLVDNFREVNDIRKRTRENYVSEGVELDETEQELRERVSEAIETEKDNIFNLPEAKRAAKVFKRNTLELEQAKELVGEDLWNTLILEEAEKLQAQFPDRSPDSHLAEATQNAFQRIYDVRRQVYDLSIVAAEEIVNEIAMRDHGSGGNSWGSLSSEEQLELLEFIQKLVGRSVAVKFDTIQAMTDTVRRNQAIPSNVLVQGYANPLDKTIVLALDRKFSKQIAGEEAFHIAQRLALNKDELAILEGYDWVHIAKENGIDVSRYPTDLQAYEAQAKVFAKYVVGEKVKGIGPQSKSLFQAIKDFLNKLANFVRGKGWKKRFPAPIDIFDSVSRGDLVGREFHYPVGPMPENFYDLNQQQIDDLVREKAKSDELSNHWNSFGLFNRVFEHAAKIAAKNPFFRRIFALFDQMRRFQDERVARGLEIMRPFSEATWKTQDEVGKFYHLLDFIATGKSPEEMAEQNIIVEADGRVILHVPTRLDDGELFDTQLRGITYEHLSGGEINGVKIEPGATIELNTVPEKNWLGLPSQYSQVEAYNAYKNGAAYRRNLIEQAVMISLAELPVDSTVEDLVALRNHQAGKVAEAVDDPARHKEETKKLNLLNYALASIQTLQSNPYYMPRMRNGTHSITVREKITEDGVVKLGPVQHMEVDSKRTAERGKTFTKVQRERVRELEEIFGPGFKVERQEFSIDQALNQAVSEARGDADFVVISSLNLMEIYLNEYGVPENDVSRGAIAKIRELAEQKSLKGINETRQPQNITGHWKPNVSGYANAVAKKQLHSMSYQLGKVMYDPLIQEEVTNLNILKTEAFKNENDDEVKTLEATIKYTNTYVNFVNDPVNKGAAVRSIVFHMAIGGRMSSAILNNFQIPQALWPWLCAMNPGRFGVVDPIRIAQNTAMMAKAYKDAHLLALRSGLGRVASAYNMKLEGKKPSYLEDEGIWSMMKQLIREGTNAPVNMEDLSESQDYKALMREGKNRAILGTVINGLANVSSYMFAYTEFVNRATTALVVYRAAKHPTFGEQVRNNINIAKEQSYLKDSGLDTDVRLENNQEGWTNAARIGVVETQFMMGKFNRPQLFYLGNEGKLGALMPIATQFMSFPLQYLEMYFKNIRRVIRGKSAAERAIGIQMAVLMTVAMIGLAGSFGLPFMENIRRLLLLFSDLDLERGMRKLLHDDLGWGAEATNLITSGALFTYMGFEGKNRVGMGTIADSGYLEGNVGAAFGPALGMLESSFKYIVDGVERGDPTMIARGIVPIGGIRDMFGFMDATERGIRTRSGKILLAPEDMSLGDYWTKIVGFYPTKAALERDRLAYAIQDRNLGQRRRAIILDRIMDLMRNASTASDPEDRRRYKEEYLQILRNYNRKAGREGLPPISNKLIGRRLLAERNPGAAQMKTMPRYRRAEFYHANKLIDILKAQQ